MRQLFRKAAEAAGLNPHMVEVANIREQCSWIHKDKDSATEKAVALGKAAVAKTHLDTPLTAGAFYSVLVRVRPEGVRKYSTPSANTPSGSVSTAP